MDKLKELHDRIQTFEVNSNPGTPAYLDAMAILNIMGDLLDEVRRVDALVERLANLSGIPLHA